MASNSAKRLDRLEKLLDTIATRHKQHHYVVVSPDDSPELAIASLSNIGIINEGDDIQLVAIHWTPHLLKGQKHIPEGSTDDPLADPRLRHSDDDSNGDGYNSGIRTTDGSIGGLPASGKRLDLPPSAERLEAWRKHERQIEQDGDRYMGEKAKHKGITY